MEEKAEATFVEGNLEMFSSRICRICLQEDIDQSKMKNMVSLYEKAIGSEISYVEKIMQITSVNLFKKKDQNLPQQICTSCISDLEAGYRFKMNCESSDAILQTYSIPPANTSKTVSETSEEINEDEEDEDEEEEEEMDEQELPMNDFYNSYKYKSEIYDGEIDGENSRNILDKELEDVLNNKQDSDVEIKPVKIKKDRQKKKKDQLDKEQEKIHICEICANQYKYRHALEVHMRRHRGDKPFKCEYCQRSFVIRFELKRHMRVHTGVKPYCCRFCERKFSDFGSRIKHERSHTGERPYVCQTCGKTFAYSHVLSGHMLTHTGEKRHQCNSCGKRFTKSHHLKSHMNTHIKALNKQGGVITQSTPASIQLSQENKQDQTINGIQEQELLNVYM